MFDMANLKKRIISSVLLIPAVITLIFMGGFLYNLFAVALCAIMIFEIFTLLQTQEQEHLIKKWLPYIITYVTLPIAALISLRNLEGGVDIMIYLFFIVSLTDTAAYFGGKNFQGPKLASKISPNKTISGALCGVLAVAIFSVFAYFFTKEIGFLSFIFLSMFFSIISQIGDLFESWVKRKIKADDSGNIIPGHGGICDRVDGLLFVLPIAYLVFALLNTNIF